MNRRVGLVAVALVALAGAVTARYRAGAQAHAPTWQVPSFALVDQDGRRFTDAELRGRPWIADFIFTSCASACPLLTARMRLVQERLAGAGVDFVSFSVDPEHDTPAALADYARRWHGGARWHLLATTPESLRALAAGMKVSVEATGAADDPVLHSNRFQLVDGDGRVRGVYDSTDDAAIARLVADAAALAGRRRPATLPTDGATLFATLGCAGCHGDRRVAAPLDGLFGARVTLDDGRTVVADDAYLRESIVDPAAKLVAGYAPSMPSYAAALDGARLDALVGYVKSLRAPRSDGARGTAAP